MGPRCLQADRIVQLLAAFPERVSQVDSLVCAGGFHMILEGRFDLAGVCIEPPPLAGNAYTLVEYPSRIQWLASSIRQLSTVSRKQDCRGPEPPI